MTHLRRHPYGVIHCLPVERWKLSNHTDFVEVSTCL